MNLLASVQIAIVIVASDLRIRRFTPMAERVLNLIPADVGRPISHIKPNIDFPELERLVGEVIDTMTFQEREVRDRQGNWYSLAIRPYKNLENRIDGAVLALFDVSTQKRQEIEIARARDFAAAVVECARDPLLVLDSGLKVQMANRAFRELFDVSSMNIEGRSIDELADARGRAAAMREIIRKVLADGRPVEGRLVDHPFPRAGRSRLRLNARPVDLEPDREPHVILVMEEVADGQAPGTTTDGI